MQLPLFFYLMADKNLMCNLEMQDINLRIKKYKLAIVRKKNLYCVDIGNGNTEKRSLEMWRYNISESLRFKLEIPRPR